LKYSFEQVQEFEVVLGSIFCLKYSFEQVQEFEVVLVSFESDCFTLGCQASS